MAAALLLFVGVAASLVMAAVCASRREALGVGFWVVVAATCVRLAAVALGAH